jgi:hypothetical protein
MTFFCLPIYLLTSNWKSEENGFDEILEGVSKMLKT